jgi:hypothetical protein
VPRKLRRAKLRPARTRPAWTLSEAQRTELRGLLADIDVEGPEDAPAFVRLLEAWEAVKSPWDALPTVPAYHAKGVWLTAGVAVVVSAIRRHVEDGN